MVLRYLLNFILLFISNFIIAQSSELGRFTVNIKKGCIPLEVEIISENIDPSVNVVQYDFNFNTTNNVFKPSSGNSFTYSTSGKYIIAQAINQDGVKKIDILEIEALNPKELDVSLFNCLNNYLEIIINDDYYDSYNLIVQSNIIQNLQNGLNEINYSNLLNDDNTLEGYVVGLFDGNDINCSKFDLKIAPLEDKVFEIIDSVKLGNDLRLFNLTYNPEKSTNYEILIDNKIDTAFFSPSFLYYEYSNIEIKNQNFNSRCIKIIKTYGCDNMEIIDEICLIYLNVFEESNGIKLEFNYNNIFDSLEVLKNNKPFKKLYKNQNSLLDNNGILENNEYCYNVIGFYQNKKSISNTFCIKSKKNYNPIPIPNAFTPNDDGLNDVFKPLFLTVSDYKMIIFNKYGEKVFESNDINIGWDGVFKGKIIQDTYVYKISFIKNDNDINVTGKFILIK